MDIGGLGPAAEEMAQLILTQVHQNLVFVGVVNATKITTVIAKITEGLVRRAKLKDNPNCGAQPYTD